jgi:type I restriction enzyme S subunit
MSGPTTNWPSSQLGEVIEVKYGKALPQAKRRNGRVPVYGSNGVVGYHDVAITRQPTIIIGRKGSFGEVKFSPIPCWPIDTTFYVDEPGPYSTEFLAWLLQSLGLTELDRSTAIPSLSRDQLYAIQVPVPPPEAQQSIALILEQLGRIRNVTTRHLMSAKQALVNYRQSVLVAACSGVLTADWREEHPEAEVPVHELVRLAGARRMSGRSQEQPINLELGELPRSYIISTVGSCAKRIEYGTSKRCGASAEGVPVLRMGNIQGGRLDLSDLKYCEVDGEIERLLLREGDLLFNRTNSPELVGKTAVFHEQGPMSFASYLIRVQFAETIADPDFVSYWINSALGREWASLAKTDGVSQSNINGAKLALMPLPLPPIEEQRVIVERVSRMLDSADQILDRVVKASRQLDRSAQAVLTKAFRGELVEP